ncbi:MAG: sulfotransferase [Acidimicrobiia bacterium]|nr:sulfotransferase [Acidimicrobiia bacterium]
MTAVPDLWPVDAPAPPCESSFANRVVIVLGSRRSGSTWLAQLLLSHPDMAGMEPNQDRFGAFHPRETMIFGSLWDVWTNAHGSDGIGIATYLGRAGAAAALRRFCDREFADARDHFKPDATWITEKTPSNSELLPMISVVYPDAWYIHLYRDGRDVARSLAGAPMGPDEVGEAAGEWAKRLEQDRQYRHLVSRYRAIRYEDLLADPVEKTLDFFRWIGLEVTPEVVAAVEERAPRQVARYGQKDAVGSGKWRQLGPHDRARIFNAAADWLAELGYLDSEPGA